MMKMSLTSNKSLAKMKIH